MGWLKQCFGTNCKCGVAFIYAYTKGNITSNLTVDRINNDEYHNLGHIQQLCVLCNTRKAYTFFSSYYMNINKNDILSKVYDDPSGYGSIQNTCKDVYEKGFKHKPK